MATVEEYNQKLNDDKYFFQQNTIKTTRICCE